MEQMTNRQYLWHSIKREKNLQLSLLGVLLLVVACVLSFTGFRFYWIFTVVGLTCSLISGFWSWIKMRRAEKAVREQAQMIMDELTMNGQNPFARSPFDADEIHPGDPGWEVFEATMRHGAVTGTYDATTGEIESIRDAEGNDVREEKRDE